VTIAAKRCRKPAISGPPSARIKPGAQGAAENLSGRPVTESSRKLRMIDTCSHICVVVKRRT